MPWSEVKLGQMELFATLPGSNSYTYDYDRYGNRRNQNKNGTGNPSYNFNTKNQITSMTYDAAGNITNDGLHTYTYDAENRLIKVDNGTVAT